MFTGIIEERGRIIDFKFKGSSAVISVEANKILNDIKLGDSIAVNGICLTVVTCGSKSFDANISEETLAVTTAKYFKKDQIINLERAIKLGDRLSGHIVTGHVDTLGRVRDINISNNFCVFRIDIENQNYMKYVIQKGSIAIDGISLTVNEITGKTIRLNIIPHTLKNTNLEFLRIGDLVNIEFDIIGKYVEKMLLKQNEGVTEELLIRSGFIGGFLK